MTIKKAIKVAGRSTCPTRPVGAVLVDVEGREWHGYEGAPTGVMHCDVLGCSTTAGVCQRAVRAELNAILRAARGGASTVGSTLYISAALHPSVTGAVINAGIQYVVCGAPVAPGVRPTLELGGVELREEHVNDSSRSSEERSPDPERD